MKFVITGITGMRNRGVEAITVPTIEQLRLLQPDIDINILSWSPDYDQIRLKPLNVNIQKDTLSLDPSSINSNSLKRRLLNKLIPNSEYWFPSSAASSIKNASAIIASGGDVFSPEYNTSTFSKPLEIALNFNTPVVFLAQSISSFRTDKQIESFLKIARQSKLITIREKATYQYLTGELGLSEDIVKLTADPAFLLSPIEKQKARAILNYYGVSKERPLVAVAPSQGICKFASLDQEEKHLLALIEIIRTIINEFQSEVIIIPHVQETSPIIDDRIIATDLIRALNYDPRVHIISADHTASEFKGLIGLCDLVIAERMHAAIAGLSSGICTIAVGYSIKAEGIMADLNEMDDLKQGLLISIEKFLDPVLACQSIGFAWANRLRIAEQIQENLPNVQERCKNNFNLLVNTFFVP
jgi:colanic acid/amylovoran biosynthesis protein